MAPVLEVNVFEAGQMGNDKDDRGSPTRAEKRGPTQSEAGGVNVTADGCCCSFTSRFNRHSNVGSSVAP